MMATNAFVNGTHETRELVPAHSEAELARLFAPILSSMERQAGVAGRFVDKARYRIHLATLWANLVMDPAACGIDETDLENAHDVINLAAERVLGEGEAITAAFRFLSGQDGEKAMDAAQLRATHRQLLLYFSSMILDPAGHRRWTEQVRKPRQPPPR